MGTEKRGAAASYSLAEMGNLKVSYLWITLFIGLSSQQTDFDFFPDIFEQETTTEMMPTSPVSVLPTTVVIADTYENLMGMNVDHSGQVCSTWGNFHFNTFDGQFFQLPYTCNYILATMCDSTMSDFNIQMRRKYTSNLPTISSFTIKLEGVVIQLTDGIITMKEKKVIIPSYQFGVRIERTTSYIKISSNKLELAVFWDEQNSLSVEIPTKYRNQTCGLCGDFNGIKINEFIMNGEQLTSQDYGHKWKMDAPTETCEEIELKTEECSDQRAECEKLLFDVASGSCHSLLPMEGFVEACIKDLCQCNNSQAECLCDTLSEYSRQCAHAGGQPQSWRTNELCGKTCPFNLEHSECGRPCKDTCSNQESSQVCSEHCSDGCFCPSGTVFNDIVENGCVPVDQCPCLHNGEIYQPGDSYKKPCQECVCSDGRWNCRKLNCPGTCFLHGGAHITTYDGKSYTFHGNCHYVLSKDNTGDVAVLGHLVQCGQTDTETCLAAVKFIVSGTTITFLSSGSILVNEIATKLPISNDQVTVFRPSTYFIIAHTPSLQLVIQTVPVMQLYIVANSQNKGNLSGLCGNFNDVQIDDFKTILGLKEGTAATFANTWKAIPNCPDVPNSNQNPCSMSVEKEKYAKEWCNMLIKPDGVFSSCHAEVNPNDYKDRCVYDTCNGAKSEESMCAALSSYVYACAAKGILLHGWRNHTCDRFSEDCPGNMQYSYSRTSCGSTCRSLSEYDPSCKVKHTPVDGCGCAEGTYLNDKGECVSDSSCPCYYNNQVVAPSQVISVDGATCTCTHGKLHCTGQQQAPNCNDPMIFFNCSSAGHGAHGVECQKSCQTMDSDHCESMHCTSGCVCPNGLLADGNGGCVQEDSCPCVHNGVSYQPGETVQEDCNTCTCRNRTWSCTHKECPSTCSIYGDGHYTTFDGRRYSFSGDCEYTLAQDYCSNSFTGSFRVITENIPCGTTGTTCSKSIKIFLGNKELLLTDEKINEVLYDNGTEIPYKIHTVGIYLVVEAKNGLVIFWDKKTSLQIKLKASFKGKVCGLCGNYDGNGKNDFVTRVGEEVVEPLEFGNSWRVSSTCPKASGFNRPCDLRPEREAWAVKHCSIIKSDVFSSCHASVDPTPYYDVCVQDTCACDSGGDCECFCTAVAAYAAACSEQRACISWRTPTICPLFCDYYNSPDGCEWHYKPCGQPCMKTCRNPSGVCFNAIPPLEGCFPQCPQETPFLDEEKMKCVKICEVYCEYNGKKYQHGEFIYSTTDGNGTCITASCSSDGNITPNMFPCSTPSTPTTTTIFTFSTPEPETTTRTQTTAEASTTKLSTVTAKISTIPSTSVTPSTVTEIIPTTPVTPVPPTTPKTTEIPPSSTQPESTTTAVVPPTTTRSIESSTPTVTEISSTTPEITTTTATILSSTTPISDCSPCKWTDWFNTNYPNYTGNDGGGETESVNAIFEANTISCEVREKIECRAKEYTDKTLSELGQKVTCNVDDGLICKNNDQMGPPCYNYEIRVKCCSQNPHCTTTTESTPSTTPTPTTTKIIPPTTTIESPTTSVTESQSTTAVTTTTVTVSPSTVTGSTPVTTPVTPVPPTTPKTTEIPTSTQPESTTTAVVPPTTTRNIESSNTTITEIPSTTPEITTTKITIPNSTTPISDCSTCRWTNWFDNNYPNYTGNDGGGETESVNAIFEANTISCEVREKIECRAKEYTDKTLSELGQKVTCNVDDGLICKNNDQMGPPCYNYEIRVKCCSQNPHCTTTTESTPSTTPTPTTTKIIPPTTTIESPTTSVTESQSTTAVTTTTVTVSPSTVTGSTPVTTPVTTVPPTTPKTTEIPTSSTQPESTTTAVVPPTTTVTIESSTPTLTTTTKVIPSTVVTSRTTENIITQPVQTTTPSSAPQVNETTTPTVTKIISTTPVTPVPPTTPKTTEIPTSTQPESTTTAVVPPTTTRSIESSTTTITEIPSTTPEITTTKITIPNSTTPISDCSTCRWTNWFDNNYPNYTGNDGGGETESVNAIFEANTISCEVREKIECRAKEYTDKTLSELGQKVTCNVNDGLICKNNDQMGPPCYNYEIRVKCCSQNPHCTTTTESTPSTTPTPTTTKIIPPTTTIESPTTSVTESQSTTAVTTTTVTVSPSTVTGSTPVTTPVTTVPPTTPKTTEIPTSSTQPESTTTAVVPPTTTVTIESSTPTLTTTTKVIPSTVVTSRTTENIITQPVQTTTPSSAPQVNETTTPTVTKIISTTPVTPVPPTTPKTTEIPTSTQPESTTTAVVPPTTTRSIESSTTTITEIPSTTPEITTTKITIPNSTTPISDCSTCRWTNWFDNNYPNYTGNDGGGETESVNAIFEANTISCEVREKIECRAKEYTDKTLSELGQKVTCNVDDGLICKNNDQMGPPCYNYEIRVKCCSQNPHCTTTTESTPSTTPTPTTTKIIPPTTTIESPTTSVTESQSTTAVTTTTVTVSPSTVTGSTPVTTPVTTVPPTTPKTTEIPPSSTQPESTTTAVVPPTTTSSIESSTTTFTEIPSTTPEITTTTATIPSSTTPTSTTELISTSTEQGSTTTAVPTTTTITVESSTTTVTESQSTTAVTTTTVTVSPSTVTGSTPVTTPVTTVPPTTPKTTEIPTSSTQPESTTTAVVPPTTTVTIESSTPTLTTTTKVIPSTVVTSRTTENIITQPVQTTTPSSAPQVNETTTPTVTKIISTTPVTPVPPTTPKTTEIPPSSTQPESTTTAVVPPTTTRSIESSTPTVTEISSTTPEITTTKLTMPSSTTPTSTTELISTTTPPQCVCTYRNEKFLPGSIIYNETDGAGWCFTAYCDKGCQVRKEPQPCITTTTNPTTTVTSTSTTTGTTTPTSTTTKSSSPTTTKPTTTTTSPTTIKSTIITTPPPPTDCFFLNPPRKHGETWTENCLVRTCFNGTVTTTTPNNISIPVCANGMPAVQVPNTCYQYACPCRCMGWGDPHYVTFDGKYYAFQGNCTYVLVQEIIKKYNFSVHIKNYYCDMTHGLACPESLTIYYKSHTIYLKQTRNPTVNTVIVNGKEKTPTISTADFTITSTGIQVTVDIPKINAQITFAGMNFVVNLPYSLFYNNTEGQCGVCDNVTDNDCRLPNGQVQNCVNTAEAWKVSGACPTPVPPTNTTTTTVSTKTKSTTTTTTKYCDPEICKVITSNVFKDCHEYYPPENFYEACKYDVCNMKNATGCFSLESYATLCAKMSVCVDWRSSTNGLCAYKCPSPKVYRACGPKVEETCNSKYNEKFVSCESGVCQVVKEGCFCPNGTTLFNTDTDICTPFCGCVGPDGLPRKPGDKWQMNCQNCECRTESMGPVCEPVTCSTPEPCNRAGYEITTVDCCAQCVCNPDLCPINTLKCDPGFELVQNKSEGDCCFSFSCRPKPVCVFNGTEYQPGVKIAVDSCKDCNCGSTLNPSTHLFDIHCSPVTCNTTCSQGFSYQLAPGKCCGNCVQNQCVYTEKSGTVHTIKVGENFVPPDETCVNYTCTKEKDAFTLVRIISSCPAFYPERCKPGTIKTTPDGCCKTCETEDCNVQKNNTFLVSNGCSSVHPVDITSCAGSCDTSSIYSMVANSMMHKCSCCQEMRTSSKEVQMNCPGGHQITYTYTYVEECGCHVTECNDHKKID
ncbi:mucin-5B-like isoform X2 [Astyanax mexicanus]|uniref:mucin-5B-like isoform X2 n=1 Tax=Astyanax mexicanus TaxID=7994 RepID=UPI0020CAB452|nr:mucin-5B-like isoform X2 [Astyanax mexicanus]